MESNGTISQWRTNEGTDILFPETQLQFGNKLKLRGGAPVCAPNFDTAPTDGPYAGIHLPKHGLVRDCRITDGKRSEQNTCFHQSAPQIDEDGWLSAGFMFTNPWSFDVWVSAKSTSLDEDKVHCLEHRITLGTELIHDCDMPYSIGFHPYFATAGDAFSLHYGNKSWSVYDLKVNEPLFVRHQYGERFIIATSHGSTEIELTSGYNGYFVWTDKPDHYICVEPVRVGYDKQYRILSAGKWVDCECGLKYTPKG